MNLGGVDIVCVDEFRYLGSSIHHNGRSTEDVDARLAATSHACGALQSLCLQYVITIFTLNSVCSMLVSYLDYFMVRNSGPRCSVIFAVCLPFTCCFFVPFWELLGHELGRSTSLMLSCCRCGVTQRILKRSLLTVVWNRG